MTSPVSDERLLDAEAMKLAAFAVFMRANEKNLAPEKIEKLWPSQHHPHWDGLAEAAILTYLDALYRRSLDTAGGVDDRALDLTKRIEREFYYDQPGGAVQTRAKVQSIIAEALSRPSQNAEVGVRKLEWKTRFLASVRSGSVLGEYLVTQEAAFCYDAYSPRGYISRHTSEDAAKAAAQADFDQRIRSALTPPAVSAGEARSLEEWHEDMGDVVWWCWRDSEWLGEPAYIGSPLNLGHTVECHTHAQNGDSPAARFMVGGWPGYHTHWTPHPARPALLAALNQPGGE